MTCRCTCRFLTYICILGTTHPRKCMSGTSTVNIQTNFQIIASSNLIILILHFPNSRCYMFKSRWLKVWNKQTNENVHSSLSCQSASCSHILVVAAVMSLDYRQVTWQFVYWQRTYKRNLTSTYGTSSHILLQSRNGGLNCVSPETDEWPHHTRHLSHLSILRSPHKCRYSHLIF